MYTLITIFSGFIILIVLLRIIVLVSPAIRFFSRGFDSGFAFSEIRLLWSLACTAKLEDPCALFLSVPLLDRCIGFVIKKAEKNNTSGTEAVQSFLNRLYTYRTKVELDPQNKKGINDTHFIAKGQKIRIMNKALGVFYSHVMNSGRHLVISLPLENNELTVSGEKWVGKKVTIYFHRFSDAFYMFDTSVSKNILYNGRNALVLNHSTSLLRSQKRKSVRCKCIIHAQLFLGLRHKDNRLKPENAQGLKCVLEDISENGALIRIGGKGKAGMVIKLQFQIEGKRVVMYGLAKSIDYDKDLNESHIHFQALEITQWCKNIILSYVYKILPEEDTMLL